MFQIRNNISLCSESDSNGILTEREQSLGPHHQHPIAGLLQPPDELVLEKISLIIICTNIGLREFN
jgi:hypothetical protein